MVRIFPIRHHSPAAALQLRDLIRATRPLVVLVEGPADADSLIELLLDPETLPPVALYAFRAGQHVNSVFYPMCAYSPEYVALQTAREIGAAVRFCDVPASLVLGQGRKGEDERLAESLSDEAPPDHRQALAAASGFDDFEAFWEAAFEQDATAGTPEAFVAAMAMYGNELRGFDPPERLAPNERRERHMASVIRSVLADGIAPEQVLVVCGAYHVAGIVHFVRAEADPLFAEAPGEASAKIVLIPYSFPRLSEQSGYGAGNRAPWYYQQVWAAGGDYTIATRLALLGVMHHWQRGGYLASLAQAIDAEVLARHLAQMRTKRQPGVDELVDAATSLYGYGDPGRLQAALHAVLIGEAVGRLSPKVGRTPLQQAFYTTAQELGLPIRDTPQELLLHLPQPREAAQSVFLHRLSVARVPFGRQLETGLGGGGRDVSGGALARLVRTLEKWQLQWTPATDAQLIERSAWGSTFEEVSARLLRERLQAATRVDEGTSALLEMALCSIGEGFDEALDRCEQLGADSASFVALAQAAYHLDGLLGYGSARALPLERLGVLTRRLFTRAVVHLADAANCGDEAAIELRERLGAAHELVQRQSPAVEDPEAYWRALEHVAEQPACHPAVRGQVLLLLELGARLPEGALADRLRLWVSRAEQPRDAAQLVAALFGGYRGTLLRNRPLVSAVTAFLQSLDMDTLVALLPVLRSSLGNLSDREREVLGETLAGVLGVGADRALRQISLSAETLVQVQAANAAVTQTLADWKARYGLG